MIIRVEWPDMAYEYDSEAVGAGQLIIRIGAGNIIEELVNLPKKAAKVLANRPGATTTPQTKE